MTQPVADKESRHGMTHRQNPGNAAAEGDFSTPAGSTTYHYFTKSWLSHVLADEVAPVERCIADKEHGNATH